MLKVLFQNVVSSFPLEQDPRLLAVRLEGILPHL